MKMMEKIQPAVNAKTWFERRDGSKITAVPGTTSLSGVWRMDLEKQFFRPISLWSFNIQEQSFYGGNQSSGYGGALVWTQWKTKPFTQFWTYRLRKFWIFFEDLRLSGKLPSSSVKFEFGNQMKRVKLINMKEKEFGYRRETKRTGLAGKISPRIWWKNQNKEIRIEFSLTIIAFWLSPWWSKKTCSYSDGWF